MKLDDLEDIIGEDALNTVTVWKKRNFKDIGKDAKERVTKHKGEKVVQRAAPADATSEGKAHSYVRNMVSQHKDSKGKQKHYDGSDIMRGLPSTFRGISNDEAGTSVYEIIKALYAKGFVDDKTIRKSKQLTAGEKASILGK